MSSKRQKTPPKDPRAAAIDAALRLASRRNWENVALADIAKEAKIRLADMARMFECREDIVCAYMRRVDQDVLTSHEGSGSEKDRIFDILMARFDRLNDDRGAVLSILQSSCADPKQLVIGMPTLARSMAWMLEGAGVETQGWKGALRVAGLTGVYAWALRTWRDDDSPDQAKTMAALDRALARVESLSGALGL